MNNNECCKVEENQRRCVADYEKTTRECLLEERSILRSIYFTINGGGETEPVGTQEPDSLMKNAQLNEDLAREITEMTKEIKMELFGQQGRNLKDGH